MPRPVLIYGATGYTGRLITHEAVRAGLEPLLVGRDPSALAAASALWSLPWEAVPLDNASALATACARASLVLNAAGPFSTTWRPIVDACLAAGVDYLDVSGEVEVIECLAGVGPAARQRGTMIMPGVGYSVIAEDALAAHALRRLPDAVDVKVGIRGIEVVSRGSVLSMIEQTGGVRCRRGGSIVLVPAGSLRHAFDYGDGPSESTGLSLGGAASVYHTTGVPNVTVYIESSGAIRSMMQVDRLWGRGLATPAGQAALRSFAALLPEGPNDGERARRSSTAVVDATDGRGAVRSSRLHGPEVYTATASLAVAVCERVLSGQREPGFQTAVGLFGPDFVLTVPGFSRVDIEAG